MEGEASKEDVIGGGRVFVVGFGGTDGGCADNLDDCGDYIGGYKYGEDETGWKGGEGSAEAVDEMGEDGVDCS